MYLFPDKVNYTNFFRMNRFLIMEKHWSNLPSASKSIYPVIGVHCDKNGVAFPSQETIGAIAGCTAKTVREGVKGLYGFPGLHVDHIVTRRGKRSNRYNIKPASTEKAKAVWLYRAFFDGGNWRLLSSKAKAVYPVVLAFSVFYLDLYWELKGTDEESLDFNEFFTDGHYEQRDFDIAEPEVDVLAEYAGVSKRSTVEALEELEDKGFIAKEGQYFKVYRLPVTIFKRDWINDTLRKLPTK